jgi:hypothetical protein
MGRVAQQLTSYYERLSHSRESQQSVHSIRQLAVVANWKAHDCCSAFGYAFAAASLQLCQAGLSKFEQCSDVGTYITVKHFPN